jgi:hypothetical protein
MSNSFLKKDKNKSKKMFSTHNLLPYRAAKNKFCVRCDLFVLKVHKLPQIRILYSKLNCLLDSV